MGWLKKSLNFSKDAYTGGWFKNLMGGGSDGKQQLARTLALQRKARADLLGGYAGAEQQARQAIPLIQKGYRGAKEATSRVYDLGRQNLVDQTDKELARDRRRMTNYGLQGSSFSSSRGIIGDSSRRIQELDAALSQSLSGLNIGQAGAEAQALGNLGNIQAQRGQALSGNNQSMAQTEASVQYQKKKDIFDLVGAVAPLVLAPYTGGLSLAAYGAMNKNASGGTTFGGGGTTAPSGYNTNQYGMFS